MSWRVSSIRFVAFPPVPTPADAVQIWSAMFGSSPQKFEQLQPSPMHPPGSSMASGVVAEGQCTVTVSPIRNDVVITPHNSPQPTPTPETQGLVDPNAAVKALVARAPRLLPVAAGRVAVLIEAMQYIDGQVTADVFRGLVPVKFPKDDVFDLAFQMNRRADIEGCKVNRLVRIGEASEQFFEMVMASGMPNPSGPIKVSERPTISLSIDINTVPAPEALIGLERLPLVWEGLANEALAILSDGYDRLAH